MNTQQKLEKLKERIIEAVPEIMELKFGCIIDEAELNGEYKGWGVVVKDKRDKFLYMLVDYGDQLEYVVDYNDDFRCKILGRPITLEDILMTINKLSRPRKRYYISEYGNFFIDEQQESIGMWQLGKSLDQQPEETIDFLYKLICK